MGRSKNKERIVVRAFELFEVPSLHSLINIEGDGIPYTKFVIHMLAVAATTKGFPRKGSPTLHYRLETDSPWNDNPLIDDLPAAPTVDYWTDVHRVLTKVGAASNRLDAVANEDPDVVIETKEVHCVVEDPREFPDRGERKVKVKVNSMTFAVETAARKFMQRAIRTEFGGDDTIRVGYEGHYSLDGLAGRATVSPFNRDLLGDGNAPKRFAVDDNSFRARRLKKKRDKRRGIVRAEQLPDGEVFVKAYHRSRKTLFRGPVFGVALPEESVGSTLLPKERSRSREAGWRRKLADYLHDRHLGDWDAVKAFEGRSETDCNMHATIRTSFEAQASVVVWFVAGRKWSDYSDEDFSVDALARCIVLHSDGGTLHNEVRVIGVSEATVPTMVIEHENISKTGE